jgi:hypothetical protein
MNNSLKKGPDSGPWKWTPCKSRLILDTLSRNSYHLSVITKSDYADIFNQHTLNSLVDIDILYSNAFAKTLEEYIGQGCVDVFPVMSLSVLYIVCHKSDE